LQLFITADTVLDLDQFCYSIGNHWNICRYGLIAAQITYNCINHQEFVSLMLFHDVDPFCGEAAFSLGVVYLSSAIAISTYCVTLQEYQ